MSSDASSGPAPATRTPGKDFILQFVATFLILAAPFLTFADSAYRIFAPETGVILLGLGGLAAILATTAFLKAQAVRCAIYAVLLTFFVDAQFAVIEIAWLVFYTAPFIAFAVVWVLRRHANAILIAFFATANLATLATSGPPAAARAGTAEPGPVRAELPVLLHLILDEHIGVDGIPRDLPGAADARRWLIDSLVSEGFYVVGRAYANHALTKYSVPATLNFSLGEGPAENSAQHAEALRIDGNRYFSLLGDRGYRLSVYQSSHVDFCADTSVRIETCATGVYTSLDNSAFNALRSPDKETVLLRFFLETSVYFRVYRQRYLRHLRDEDPGAEAPPFLKRLHGTGLPFTGMSTLNRMIDDAEGWQRGHAYFGHVILPHQPYIFGPSCDFVLPVLSWAAATDEVTGERAEVYRRYLDQMRCTHRKIQELFGRMKAAGVFHDALIVLHSDHGSRIGPGEFFLDNRASFNDRHLIDGFSALFAARAPNFTEGYSPRMDPLPVLLREFAMGLEPAPGRVSPAEVFFWSDEPDPSAIPKRARLPFEFPIPDEG